MRILALDGSGARCSVACCESDHVAAHAVQAAGRGHAALLPPMVRDVLGRAGWHMADVQAIGIGVGPGSFTGIRAAIAMAQGLALGSGAAVFGVTVGEALRAAVAAAGRPLWVAVDSRRGHLHLDRDGSIASVRPEDVPRPSGPVAVAGDAAGLLAATLAARGTDVLLTDARHPDAVGIARAAMAQARGTAPLRPALPLYIDPPAIGQGRLVRAG